MAPDMLEDAVKFAAGGAGAGGGAVGIMFLLRWFLTFMAGRADIKQDRLEAQATELDRQWKEYREALETDRKALRAELSIVRQDVERCHSEKHDLEQRIAKMEGFAAGRGEAVQIGQVSQSIDRIFKDKERGQ
jgi:uncharacterized protein (DUF3084 family)